MFGEIKMYKHVHIALGEYTEGDAAFYKARFSHQKHVRTHASSCNALADTVRSNCFH